MIDLYRQPAQVTLDALHRDLRARGWLWSVEPIGFLVTDDHRFAGPQWRATVRRPGRSETQVGNNPTEALKRALEMIVEALTLTEPS
jgi:hypothetical protein